MLCGAAIAGGAAWFVIDRVNGDDRRLSNSWQRGMNVTAFLPDAYAEPKARQALLTARATGTRRVALVPTWYMAGPSSNEVYADPDKTPTDASIEAAAANARALGLGVVHQTPCGRHATAPSGARSCPPTPTPGSTPTRT